MKFKVVPKLKHCLTAVFALIVTTGLAQAQANREADVQRYLDSFLQASQLHQKTASQELGWQGLSDPRVFDLVEKNLLESYKAVKQRSDADYSAWLAKALAYSGSPKYRATLEEVANNGLSRGLQNHAKAALELQPLYAKWNPIINDTSRYAADQSPEINRFANMIRSNDKRLQEVAARRIIEQKIKDEYLLDIVQTTVAPDVTQAWTNDDDVKSVAYMLKALAVSGHSKYLPTVETAAAEAVSPKLKKYALGYLK